MILQTQSNTNTSRDWSSTPVFHFLCVCSPLVVSMAMGSQHVIMISTTNYVDLSGIYASIGILFSFPLFLQLSYCFCFNIKYMLLYCVVFVMSNNFRNKDIVSQLNIWFSLHRCKEEKHVLWCVLVANLWISSLHVNILERTLGDRKKLGRCSQVDDGMLVRAKGNWCRGKWLRSSTLASARLAG